MLQLHWLLLMKTEHYIPSLSLVLLILTVQLIRICRVMATANDQPYTFISNEHEHTYTYVAALVCMYYSMYT